jgi:hypothetical protein
MVLCDETCARIEILAGLLVIDIAHMVEADSMEVRGGTESRKPMERNVRFKLDRSWVALRPGGASSSTTLISTSVVSNFD